METVTAVVDEALKEAIGTSRRRWALVVVAFVAGALGAFWLIRRARKAMPETVQPDATTS